MPIDLPEKLTVENAGEVKTLLLAALDAGAVALDATGVREVDVTGLQLLCAARRSAEARGVPLALPAEARSPALREAISLAGFDGAAWIAEVADA